MYLGCQQTGNSKCRKKEAQGYLLGDTRQRMCPPASFEKLLVKSLTKRNQHCLISILLQNSLFSNFKEGVNP